MDKRYHCVHCGDTDQGIVGHGRCPACYQYFRKYGIERPLDVIERTRQRRANQAYRDAEWYARRTTECPMCHGTGRVPPVVPDA